MEALYRQLADTSGGKTTRSEHQGWQAVLLRTKSQCEDQWSTLQRLVCQYSKMQHIYQNVGETTFNSCGQMFEPHN